MTSLAMMMLLGALACGGGIATPAPVEASAPEEDPVLLLGDLQYLLAKAVAAHGAGDLALAHRSWSGAVQIWHTSIAPIVRRQDALDALELEYAIGQLGSALRQRGSEPTASWRALDRALLAVQPSIAAARSPQAP